MMPETILTLGALGALFCFIGIMDLFLSGALLHSKPVMQRAAHRGGVAFALLGMMVWVGLMTWIIAEAEYTEERAIRNVIADIYDEIPT